MPKFLQYFANMLPSTPYFNIFSMLSDEGATFNNIQSGFIHLLIILIFGYFTLYLRYRFMYKKES